MLVIYRILFPTTNTLHPLYARFFLWLSPVRAVVHLAILVSSYRLSTVGFIIELSIFFYPAHLLASIRAVIDIIICQGKGEGNFSISYISTFQDRSPPRFLKEIVEHIFRARYLFYYHASMRTPVQAEKRPLLKKCQQQIYPGGVPLLIIMIEMCAL